METALSDNNSLVLPPARDLLRSSVEEEEDRMVIDEPEKRKIHQGNT
jgi:hypothetical protein